MQIFLVLVAALARWIKLKSLEDCAAWIFNVQGKNQLKGLALDLTSWKFILVTMKINFP